MQFHSGNVMKSGVNRMIAAWDICEKQDGSVKYVPFHCTNSHRAHVIRVTWTGPVGVFRRHSNSAPGARGRRRKYSPEHVFTDIMVTWPSSLNMKCKIDHLSMLAWDISQNATDLWGYLKLPLSSKLRLDWFAKSKRRLVINSHAKLSCEKYFLPQGHGRRQRSGQSTKYQHLRHVYTSAAGGG